MASLNEISYMILETVRENHIVDDERIDIRLIYDWINLKRAQYIKNSRNINPNNRINLNLYQTINVSVFEDPVIDAGDYPFLNNTTQLYKIIQSTDTIPTIIEDKNGPIILSLESEDSMKLPFSVVDYDYLKFAGSGRFNTGTIFGAVRDNYVFFKYNAFFDRYNTVKLRAIFEDPTAVTDFDEDVDRYPADLGLVEYIKNGIYDKDIRMIFNVKADEVNDASGDIKQ